jgi:hypothetical protein
LSEAGKGLNFPAVMNIDRRCHDMTQAAKNRHGDNAGFMNSSKKSKQINFSVIQDSVLK